MTQVVEQLELFDSLPRSELIESDIPRLDSLLKTLNATGSDPVSRQLVVAVRYTIRALTPHLPYDERRIFASVAASVLDRLEVMPDHVWRYCSAHDQLLVVATLRTYLPVLPFLTEVV